jgi:hypothetical protein
MANAVFFHTDMVLILLNDDRCDVAVCCQAGVAPAAFIEMPAAAGVNLKGCRRRRANMGI